MSAVLYHYTNITIITFIKLLHNIAYCNATFSKLTNNNNSVDSSIACMDQ